MRNGQGTTQEKSHPQWDTLGQIIEAPSEVTPSFQHRTWFPCMKNADVISWGLTRLCHLTQNHFRKRGRRSVISPSTSCHGNGSLQLKPPLVLDPLHTPPFQRLLLVTLLSPSPPFFPLSKSHPSLKNSAWHSSQPHISLQLPLKLLLPPPLKLSITHSPTLSTSLQSSSQPVP